GAGVARGPPFLVPADVGDQHRVVGQGGAEVGQDAFGSQRELVAAAAFGTRGEHPGAGGVDLLAQRGAARGRGSLPADRVQDRAYRRTGVGDHADLDRIVTADLGRV